MKTFRQFRFGSAKYVILHAAWRRQRGKNPSLSFGEEHNPRKALVNAKRAYITLITVIEVLYLPSDLKDVAWRAVAADALDKGAITFKSVLSEMQSHTFEPEKIKKVIKILCDNKYAKRDLPEDKCTGRYDLGLGIAIGDLFRLVY